MERGCRRAETSPAYRPSGDVGTGRFLGAARRAGEEGRHPPDLLPLDAGEQYRFGFAMDACIGCHSCEVACAEQNDTPIDGAWRRVGGLEGGSFPDTRRFNLSMACNHCVEPTCLSGCPTSAYVKLSNGVVGGPVARAATRRALS